MTSPHLVCEHFFHQSVGTFSLSPDLGEGGRLEVELITDGQ